jgi:HD-GYP domain-containing protein (c-di-GMP phosphodiesterase class II)
MAQAMGYNLIDRADLLYAAALHDIGVLSVEEKIDRIRLKAQKADASEYEHRFPNRAEIRIY